MVRQPWVTGVAGGVGTTTVAAALAAIDCGVYRSGPVEVVVCRNTVSSVGLAHRVIQYAVGRPVLVVVACSKGATSKPAAARIEMARPHVSAVVAVPWVERWCELVNPWAQAAGVLTDPQNNSKHLRGFTRAMQQLQTQLATHPRAGSPAAAPPPVQPAAGPATGSGPQT